MRLGLEKASGRAKCRHEQCQRKTEYINEKGRIKSGTTCVWISTEGAGGWHTSYYCRDCVDKIYEEMKKILNPKLWIFH
jgi:hypothetical protein